MGRNSGVGAPADKLHAFRHKPVGVRIHGTAFPAALYLHHVALQNHIDMVHPAPQKVFLFPTVELDFPFFDQSVPIIQIYTFFRRDCNKIYRPGKFVNNPRLRKPCRTSEQVGKLYVMPAGMHISVCRAVLMLRTYHAVKLSHDRDHRLPPASGACLAPGVGNGRNRLKL